VHERTESSLVVTGTLTMRELQAETGWAVEWQPRETVAQWAVRHLGRQPQRNEAFNIGDYRLTAIDVNPERIRRLKIEKPAPLAD
jgi:CBS domain containing-hemolysin-like protein